MTFPVWTMTSCAAVFPPATLNLASGQALLAGDALQAEAFGTILRCDLPVQRRAACAEMLAGAAGIDGICGGQYLDLAGEETLLTEELLTELHGRKTGSLLVAACQMGVAAAGGNEEQLEAAGSSTEQPLVWHFRSETICWMRSEVRSSWENLSALTGTRERRPFSPCMGRKNVRRW